MNKTSTTRQRWEILREPGQQPKLVKIPQNTGANDAAEPTQPLDDIAPLGTSDWVWICSIFGAIVVLALACMGMVAGYGWVRIGRDFLALVLERLSA